MILKIYKIFRIFLLLLFISLSVYALKFYQGSSFIYLLYCLSFIIMFYYLTDNKSSYFEIFFSTYLFLGFWFKFIFSLIFYGGRVYDSGQLLSTKIDTILIMGIIISLVVSVSSYITKRVIKIKDANILQKKNYSFFEILYLKNTVSILSLFFIIFISIGYLNYEYQIYQRGFISLLEVNFFLKNLIKWSLLFGFTTFSCFFIHTEILYKKKINFLTILISFVEIFTSYTSMLSRSFVINSASIMLPTYQKSLILKKNYNNFFYLFFVIVLILSAISIYTANQIRIDRMHVLKQDWLKMHNKNLNGKHEKRIKVENYNFEMPIKELSSEVLEKENQIQSDSLEIPIKELSSEVFEKENQILKNKKLIQTKINNVETKKQKSTPIDMIKFILINRWIGIESLILVHYSEKASFNLLFDSLSEKKNIDDNTFYEKTFNLDENKIIFKNNSEVLKGNTLPGIITFLYYSGSLLFVSISLFLIIFIFTLFEKFILNISSINHIYSCFISHMIATRLFHFGYAPKDSYLFLMSVLLSVTLIFILYNKNFFSLNQNKSEYK